MHMQCPQCGGVAGLSDNFCPVCGATLRAPRLPVLRGSALPAAGEFAVAGVIKQAAVLAAGAALPVILRSVVRLAISTARARRVAPAGDGQFRLLPGTDGPPLQIETHSVVELHTIRNIRVRR
jgi:hypothetical protein